MTIFVSIAAYRDPQLVPTISDAIDRARYPRDLRFGVCWQHEPGEVWTEVDASVALIDVPFQESRGACWARAEIMKLWDGEDWYLQLDSHHRFVDDWDAILMAEATLCGAWKPLLTTYATPFDPFAPSLPPGEPMRMDFDYFAEGIPLFRPHSFPEADEPVSARFVSAHFLFAPGRFVEDVPYDPDLYFHGEEIMLAVRAFTHGYALFHPSRHILWHEYTRSYRVKHWDDHSDWWRHDLAAREKVQRFLAAPHTGPFGCGTERSFAAYEAHAGLSLTRVAA